MANNKYSDEILIDKKYIFNSLWTSTGEISFYLSLHEDVGVKQFYLKSPISDYRFRNRLSLVCKYIYNFELDLAGRKSAR